MHVGEETLKLLRDHKRTQAELKLANRLHYVDSGLVFAQGWEGQCLGAPLSAGMIDRMLEELLKTTGVRRINVHGLRHTCATLALAAGVQSKVVQERLGHRNISTTLDLYAHVLEGQQADAAERLSTLLHPQRKGRA